MATNYKNDANIVAYYDFESGAFDQSGTGDNYVDDDATSYPTEDAPNKKRGVQSAAFVAASSQRLQCTYANLTADFPGKEASTGFTVMAWVRIPSTPASTCGVMGIRGASAALRSWTLGIGTDQSVYFGITNNSDSEVVVYAPSVWDFPFDGTWHHVCGVLNSADSKFYCYVDGNPGSSGTLAGTLKLPSQPFYIGRAGSSQYMDGNIDEVAIFNRTLTVTEINEIIGCGLDGSLTPVTQTFYACMGGDGTDPRDGTAAHAWDISDLQTSLNWMGAFGQEMDKLSIGDTLVLMHDGGSFTGVSGDDVLLVRRGGISGYPMTIEGDGETIIDGGSLGYCIHGVSVNYTILSNLEIQYGKWYNVFFYNSNYGEIKDCEIHHCLNTTTSNGSLCVIDGDLGYGHGWHIHYNYLHDTVEDHGIYLGKNDNTVEYNIVTGIKDSGIKFRASFLEYNTGNIIRYNWLVDNGYDDIQLCTTDGADVYGNVFFHSDYGGALTHRFGILLGDDVTGYHVKGTKIWNNVFYGYAYSMIEMEPTLDASNKPIAVLKNNVFHVLGGTIGPGSTNQYFIESTDANGLIDASNYNDFYNANATPMWKRYGAATDTTLALWRTGSGHDAQSIDTNPLLGDPANGDFSLQSGSPARGAGTTGGPTQGLHFTTRVANFGRNGAVVLADYAVGAIDEGAFVYGAERRSFLKKSFAVFSELADGFEFGGESDASA